MMSYCDFKETSLTGARKFYFNVSKYMSNRDLKWLPTANNYPDMSTLFRIYSYGYANGYPMAKLHVTWYVLYKEP